MAAKRPNVALLTTSVYGPIKLNQLVGQSSLQPAAFTESRLCSSARYHPLTSAIYISAGHEGMEDTIKCRVKDFDPVFAGGFC